MQATTKVSCNTNQFIALNIHYIIAYIPASKSYRLLEGLKSYDTAENWRNNAPNASRSSRFSANCSLSCFAFE